MRFTIRDVFVDVDADYSELKALDALLTVDVPGRFFDPSYRYGDWDGKERFLVTDGGCSRFYTGLLEYVRTNLPPDTELDVVDEREDAGPGPIVKVDPEMLNGITLRDYQCTSITKLLYKKRGVVELPTGAGKSEAMIASAKLLGGNGLIIVPGIFACLQLVDRFRKRGVEASAYWGGDHDLSAPTVVAVVDSAYLALKRHDEDFIKRVEDFRFMFFDECHWLGGREWVMVAEAISTSYRVGFSGSAFGGGDIYDNRDLSMVGLTGPLLAHVPVKALITRGHLANPIVTFLKCNYPRLDDTLDHRKAYTAGIVENHYRTRLGVSLAQQCAAQGMKVLILVHEIAHGRMVLQMLRDREVLFGYGGGRVERYVGDHEEPELVTGIDVLERFRARPSGVFVFSSVANESIDAPDVDVGIRLGGRRSPRTTRQIIGRILRAKQDKPNVAFYFDFLDQQHRSLRSAAYERRKTLTEDGHEIHTDLMMVNCHLARPLVLTDIR